MAFDHLFRSGSIGSLVMRNRIVMPAMATNFASAWGEPTPRLIAYYARRSLGGAGLITVENANIEDPVGGNGATQLRIDHDRFIPGLHHLVQTIHAGGARVSIQINHAGALADPKRTGCAPRGPSPVAWGRSGVLAQPLSSSEIDGTIECFCSAAERAKRAGFDAVEIHGGHGYLIAQFLSPLTNHRTDEYGGSPEARWRFALQVVEQVRERVGASFPIVFRLSIDEFVPGGRDLEESIELCQALVDVGVDAISATAGTSTNLAKQLEPMSYPQGWRAYLASAVKKSVKIPVITVGVIRTPDVAERILQEGNADFVAIGRGLIADPDWPKKAQSGDIQAIRRCISCNRCVRQRVFDDLPICCSVNPMVGQEASIKEARTRDPKRIVVVGGGPAGMQAAASAAQAGHNVILFEEQPKLGGQLLLACVPPHKEKVKWLIDDLSRAIPASVDIRLGQRVDEEILRNVDPDMVILATGATAGQLDVPGGRGSCVVTSHEVLRKGMSFDGARVAVVGAGMVGCETAAYLADRGCSVILLETLDLPAGDCEPITRVELLDRLNEMGVRILTGVTVQRVSENGQIVITTSEEIEKNFDTERVVMAVGATSNHALEEGLSGSPFDVVVVGDARSPRGIQEAVFEGWNAVIRRGKFSPEESGQEGT